MLEVLTGNEIVFYPISSSDQKLKGQIQLRNANNSRYLVFKIKSTDINAFQADPSRGILDPFETKTIPVLTTRSVDADYAKILAQKNKFLIQYVLLNTRPSSIDEATSSLKSANCQSIKLYINTDSARGYSTINSNRQPSVIGTNKVSYHSVAHGRSLPNLPSSSNIISPVGDQIQNLKQEISRLEIQRARLKDSDGSRKDNKGGFLKYIILMTIGLIAGNLGSKHLGLNQFINQKLTPAPVVLQQSHDEEGFFSIFNFGNDDQKPRLNNQEQKSWWDIL